jgi:hypothetical protein
MRASSVALEVAVDISQDELKKLETKPLSGLLKFEDFFSIPHIRRNIPFNIEYIPRQKELLMVEQEPKEVYFGEANRLKFIINSEYYDSLVSERAFVDRFLSSGKLSIRVIFNI